MPTATTAKGAVTPDVQAMIARVTRDQGPEYEQTLLFSALAQVSTPTAIRTDRKIKFITLHMRGRITNAGTGPTYRAPVTVLSAGATNNGALLFSLLQQITVRGQHLRYGAQTILQQRGEAAAEYMALLWPNWTPIWTVTNSAGGTNGRSGALSATASATIDFDFVLPLPLFPPGLNAGDQPFYCLHGPDWPGNLYIDVLCADGTALATANPATTFAGFGGGGSPSIDILTERPLLGKDLMAAIKPALTFRISYTGQPTAAISGASGTGIKLTDLTVGKDTARIFLKTGTQAANNSAGVVTYATLSDSMVTRTFVSLDNRQLRFQNANADSTMQDYMGRSYGRVIPIGYKMIDFISGMGVSSADNPKAAFPSSKLTAARKFELDGDVTAAANQIAEVTQEMILGRPQYVGA